MPKKVIIFFSEVIDSPIFKSLIFRLSEESLETKFVFIGTETEPLFNYTLNLRQDALFLGGSAKKKIAPHLFQLLKSETCAYTNSTGALILAERTTTAWPGKKYDATTNNKMTDTNTMITFFMFFMDFYF